MTTEYSQNFTAAKDKLRLLIFDRKPPHWSSSKAFHYAFSDEELAQLYSQNGSNLWMTAAHCVEILALDAAKRAVNFDLLQQDLRVDRTLTPTHLLKLADRYRERARMAPAVLLGQWQDGDDEWLKTIMNFDEYDMEDSVSSS